MDLAIALTINGLVWGLIVALIALGLSIIFGLLDIINVAHGDFFMVGTVLVLVIAGSTGFWIALILVPLLGFALGLVIERLIIRPTINAAALTIATTFGLSMIMQESVRATFGAQARRMPMPVDGTIAPQIVSRAHKNAHARPVPGRPVCRRLVMGASGQKTNNPSILQE